MDLRSNYPYWLLRHGIIQSYPSLTQHINADVAVIGSGISGALNAWYLINAGFNVVIIDRRHIAMGSTAASTALLQYEIDVPLHVLAGKVGQENASRSYQLCRQMIYDIEGISGKLEDKTVFSRKPSFQFASHKKDYYLLEKEYNARRSINIPVQWMNRKDVIQNFGFDRVAGLLSSEGAELDAYQFTHLVLRNCIRKGLRVYDHTAVVDIQHHKKNVVLLTEAGKKIRADKLVIACGYESQQYLPVKVQKLRSTYAIVSEPMPGQELWYKNSLIWETDDPYIYMRSTADHRILLGGKDVFFSNPIKRDKLIASKAKALEKTFHELFPHIPFRTDFKWAGTFATTKDGLPYIGTISNRPHTYFALGFGGNGITFSALAAQLIRDHLQGKKNKDAGIFRFDR